MSVSSVNMVKLFHCYCYFLSYKNVLCQIGDGGVDISPIADLLKSEVRELARELGIEKAIIDAPPTDGLYSDMRSDETQIGATYDELELAMKYQESDKNQLSNRQKEVLKIYSQRHEANEHKMIPIPVCIIPKELRQAN